MLSNSGVTSPSGIALENPVIMFLNEGGGCLARACEPNKPKPRGADAPRTSLYFRNAATMVLLRFGSSQTGALHLGGLGTALFSHICTRKLWRKWILRIEDTDVVRVSSDIQVGLQRILGRLGISRISSKRLGRCWSGLVWTTATAIIHPFVQPGRCS